MGIFRKIFECLGVGPSSGGEEVNRSFEDLSPSVRLALRLREPVRSSEETLVIEDSRVRYKCTQCWAPLPEPRGYRINCPKCVAVYDGMPFWITRPEPSLDQTLRLAGYESRNLSGPGATVEKEMGEPNAYEGPGM